MNLKPSFILAASIAFFSVSGCKQIAKTDSSLSDLNPERTKGYAPGTHLVLKDSIKRLVSEIKLVKSGIEDGAYVYTVTNITFSKFETNTNGITAKLLLDVSVDASKSEMLTRRAAAGANLSFTGIAEITLVVNLQGRAVQVSYKGIEWVQPLTHYISTWTNARLFVGAIHNGAQQQAIASVPSVKEKIKEQIVAEISNGISEQNPVFSKFLHDLSAAVYDVPEALPKLTSDQHGVYFQTHIKNENNETVLPPPSTPLAVDTGVVYHQSVFTNLLRPNLAGKNIILRNLGKVICQSFSRSLFEICVKDADPAPVDVEMIFDQARPVQFTFAQNQLALEMNFSVKVTSNERTLSYLSDLAAQKLPFFKLTEGEQQSQPGSQIFMDANGTPQIGHETPTMQVIVIYSLGNRQFNREDPKVKITSAATVGDDVTRSEAYRRSLVVLFTSQIKKALPTELAVPSLPSYATTQPQIRNVGGALVVMDPSHFGIKDSWLHTYFTHCSATDTQTSLGVTMQSTKDAKGTNRILISSVSAGTPASKAKVVGFKYFQDDRAIEVDYKPAAGLRKGDIIYFTDGREEVVSVPELFSGYLAGKSLSSNSVARLQVGRLETLPGLEKPVWLKIDYDVQLRKVCKTAK